MGYRVQYGSFKYDNRRDSKKNIFFWGVLALALAVTVVTICFPGHVSKLGEKIFPFFQPEVREAFSEMMVQIGEGTSVSEAAGAFCREIIFENN